ncbi:MULTISPECIES: lipoyl(octanoyl) transferase LipB [Halomonas]|uniref:Octanoyltransferase n=1 Tax=Halomonas litopenaei TaxID=2109328 RepID=A0ABX5ITV8_9GAMM|nr:MULTISPECIES: lipoyl(octanoyl) transferase LipB [Halomonas]MBR9770210.1 lipoyl(octanoyl) transferase LipB [Gammaproteobacteria bacterium]MAR72403.1 lipoyl(octanoyl) transferase LipB [Halomonas sp.]MAY70873.1 lipoyl(octanoyl) transferase LipB [Halomonas sp.]MBR9878570.1 lipoyl(octanoyl) transferase LipB [Gammaproteobacteria bacterium]MBY5942885.1 lipoyl(octanoyl) transferase LipB [Halomonas sp. DP5N14-9]|tara:strand:- start:1898 stop:2569 length:672 start_codon:yes stop_codon:yes gene_type:complete
MEAIDVYHLGLKPYRPVWQAMRELTDTRDGDTPDQIWVVQHPPVFTQGQAGKPEHLLMPGEIPVVETDRGGQVTYHGPGQLVLYPLIDVKRARLGVRDLVSALEDSVVDALGEHGIEASARPDAPGVYVGERKIASLGLRIRRGASFHGIAVNLEVDLTPFSFINPCGYAGLEMTRLADLVSSRLDMEAEARRLLRTLATRLGQRELIERPGLPGVLDAHNFD